MRLATPRTIGFEHFAPSRLGVVLLVTVAGLAGVTTVALGRTVGHEARRMAEAPAAFEDPDAPPSAAGFAHTFVALMNAYARANGEEARVSSPHCVPGSPGHYMCAYVVSRPHGRRECHLMQAEWTPGAPSSFQVTLSGRAGRCGSVRQAVRSLR